MKHFFALLVLGFGAGAFYGIVQQRRSERIEKKKLRLVTKENEGG